MLFCWAVFLFCATTQGNKCGMRTFFSTFQTIKGPFFLKKGHVTVRRTLALKVNAHCVIHIDTF